MLLLLSGMLHVDFNWGAFGSLIPSPSTCSVHAALPAYRFLCSQRFFFKLCIFIFCSFGPRVILSPHFAIKAFSALL